MAEAFDPLLPKEDTYQIADRIKATPKPPPSPYSRVAKEPPHKSHEPSR